jgi:hypothetical protein
MTMTEFIDQQKASAAGNADRLRGLEIATALAEGKRCPKGHTEGVARISQESAYCTRCKGAYDLEEAVAEHLTDIGVNVYGEG